MRILKLIAISIVENRAKRECSDTRVSLGEHLDQFMGQNDLQGVDITLEILKKKENEIKDWKEKWVSRIEKL